MRQLLSSGFVTAYMVRFVSAGCLWVGAGAELFSVAAVPPALIEEVELAA